MSQHRTPLRYPGGKQRLAPFILEILESNNLLGGHYVEPYAGGAGVALDLLLGNHVSHIHLNDASAAIYAFWNSILTRPEEFCRRIVSASMNVDEWKKHREIVQHPYGQDEFELGYSTFYLNRCNRSGVISGGVIGGLKQEGKWKMDARFPRNELIRRIESIASRKDFISLRNLDAKSFISEHVNILPKNTFVYCDPPYFEKSSRLYLNRYSTEGHAEIAEIIQKDLSHKWIVSYDAVAEILNYYKNRRKFIYDLANSSLKCNRLLSIDYLMRCPVAKNFSWSVV